MNKLWGGMILLSIVAAFIQGVLFGHVAIASELMQATFDMAQLSVEIALGLIGLLCFWMGILKLGQAAGMLDVIARALTPLLHRLMPEVPRHHPAFGHITMNMAANIFGLDNAATPSGIKAMESLQTLNKHSDTATNSQIMFLVINTSSVTLFPVTILMYRAQLGAANPADVFVPIVLATTMSTLMGIATVAMVQRINLFKREVLAYFGGLVVLLWGLLVLFANLDNQKMAEISSAIGNGMLISVIGLFIAMGLRRKVAIYEEFISGAKEGFDLAIKIIPYLVAMLVAIGLLRASGVLEAFSSSVSYLVAMFGGDTRFIDALPTGLMNPFSGSGARALMLETMESEGVDSFAGRLAAIFQGSTETTFYVLAVYFGAVNVKKLRHAIGCGLVADLAGIVAAIFIAYWFFG